MPQQAVVRFPTIRLRKGDDDELINWIQSLGDEYGHKTQAIKGALRRGINAERNGDGAQSTLTSPGTGVTSPTLKQESEQSAVDASQKPNLERGEAWAVRLLQHRHGEMPTATVEALAASRNFRDVVAALDAIERFFESRDSWNEIILSTLWLACQQLLHRIQQRRQELAPEDRRRMQELAEQNLPFMSPPDLAKELADRAELLYDQQLSFEERQRLTATIRVLFEEDASDAGTQPFTH